MPTPDTDERDRRASQRGEGERERDERDEHLRREVGTLEATVQAMWDLLGGKEERDDASSLPHAR